MQRFFNLIHPLVWMLICIVCLTLSCNSPNTQSSATQTGIAPYVDFIKAHQQTSAKDYILHLFDSHDFVIICERDHRDISQYHLYQEIIADPYFIHEVGNVFMEIGVKNSQERVRNFIFSENLDSLSWYNQLRDIQRNASYYPVWEKYNYSYFIESVYEINQNLDMKDKIQVFPSDMPMDWNAVRTYSDVVQSFSRKAIRDSLIAQNIIGEITRLKQQTQGPVKALMILNYHHAFNDLFTLEPSTGNFLFKTYKGKIANVLMNYATELVEANHGTEVPFQDGKWDAAFLVNGNPSIGFDFKDSPFGRDTFDFYPYEPHDYTYADIFTGYAFYQPISDFKLVLGFPGYLDDGFMLEALRRIELLAQWRRKDSTLHFTQLSKREENRLNQLNEIPYSDIDTIQTIIHQRVKEYKESGVGK